MMRDKLQEALTFAVAKHAGHWRDDERGAAESGCPLPYAFHPVEVTANLRHIGGITDLEVLCAGLLHDTLEDTETTLAELVSNFGEKVTTYVLEVTRQEPSDSEIAGLSKDEIWEIRNAIFMAEIVKMSDVGKTIKLADRLSNLKEARYAKSPAKFARYLKQSIRILELIPQTTNPALWQALKTEVTRP